MREAGPTASTFILDPPPRLFRPCATRQALCALYLAPMLETMLIGACSCTLVAHSFPPGVQVAEGVVAKMQGVRMDAVKESSCRAGSIVGVVYHTFQLPGFYL